MSLQRPPIYVARLRVGALLAYENFFRREEARYRGVIFDLRQLLLQMKHRAHFQDLCVRYFVFSCPVSLRLKVCFDRSVFGRNRFMAGCAEKTVDLPMSPKTVSVKERNGVKK